MQLPRRPIAPLLPPVAPGEVLRVGPLSVIPLRRDGQSRARFIPLARALEEGTAELKELDRPEVPLLRCLNRGVRPLFTLAGEELRGGRQDRVANVSAVLSPGQAIELPVSCVERGRWHPTGQTFSSGGRTLSTTGRAALCRSVSQSIVVKQSRHSDQMGVWAEVERCSTQIGTQSFTGSLFGVFAAGAEQIEGAVERLSSLLAADEQVGVVVYQDGRFTGLDLFADGDLCRHYLPALVRGAALDALAAGLDLEGKERPRPVDDAAIAESEARHLGRRAERFLDRFSRCSRGVEVAGVGLGRELRLQAAGFTGSALLVDEELVHLSVYSAGAGGGVGQRPSAEDDRAAFMLEVRGHHPTRVALPAGTFTVGRGHECEVQVLHPRVSRKHVVLHVDNDGAVEAEDQGSLNGTRVGSGSTGHVKGRIKLTAGQTLCIGTREVRLTLLQRC
jgi:hypothetical protein